MANTTGGAALADRPTEAVWLSPLPARNAVVADRVPALLAPAHLHRVVRPAEGLLSGLPGAVTDLAVSRDGRHLVAAHYGEDAVSIIDTATLTLAAEVLDVAEPYAIAVADRLFVRSASISIDSVVAVDLESGDQLAGRDVGIGAEGIAVSPHGETVYVARNLDSEVDIAVVDVESGRITTIPVSGCTSIDTVRINRAGTRLYAALTTFAGGAVARIDIRTGRVQTVAVGHAVGDLAIDDKDRRIFATCADPDLGRVLRIVDTMSMRVVHTVAIGGLPVGVLCVGGMVFLADGEDVIVVDGSNGRIINRIEIERSVSCLAVSQDGSRLYVGDFAGNVASLSVRVAAAGQRSAS